MMMEQTRHMTASCSMTGRLGPGTCIRFCALILDFDEKMF